MCLHFDRLDGILEAERKAWEAKYPGAEVLVIYYADDVAFVVAQEDPQVLVKVVRHCAEDVERALADGLQLMLNAKKSFNMILSPGSLLRGIFKRGDGAVQGGKKRTSQQGRSSWRR